MTRKADRLAKHASTCLRKVAYPTREAAQRARAAVVGKGDRPATLGAYRCPVCRLWHLGNSPA